MLENATRRLPEIIILPIFGLNLPGVLQYPYIDEQVFRGLQAPRQINVSPPAFVRRKQIPILPEVFLLLWAERTLITRIRAYDQPGTPPMASSWVLQLLCFLLQDIGAAPAHLLQLLRTDSMVGQQATFVAPHGQMVDQHIASYGWLGRRIEGAFERCKDGCNIFI